MSRKKKHPEHVNHERWLVSYADFITLLFAFFTTLYAISTVDQKKAGKLQYSMRSAFNVEFFPSTQGMSGYSSSAAPLSIGEGSTGDMVGGQASGSARKGQEQQFKQLAQALTAMSLDDPRLEGRVSVRIEKRGIVISLAEAAFFASGEAVVRPEALEALDLIVGSLKDVGYDLIVEGHTDHVPVRAGHRFRDNWELSTSRATTVVAFLVEQRGFAPSRLSAAGYGDQKPIADNTTAEGRARNRRVDIVVLPPTGTDVGAAPTAAPTSELTTHPAEADAHH